MSAKIDQPDLDYVKAAIETLDLIELFLIRVNNIHRINEFNFILQILIERATLHSKSDENIDIPSSDSVKDIRSSAKYWEGVGDTLIVMKNQWEELADTQPFLKILFDDRNSFSLNILSDAISPLNDIVDRFFFIRRWDFPLEQIFADEDKEDDVLSLALREALQILREEEDKIDLTNGN